MDRYGFIHEKLEIKILILFVLRRLPGTVDPESLLDLCTFDGGVGYFDYTDCLSELTEGGLIEQNEDGYAITPKGAKNADMVESRLPYSVRSKALKLIEPVAERLERAALITARHVVDEKGCTVELRMSDGEGEVIGLRLLCGDEEQARRFEKRFKNNAETYYQKIMELLDEQ